MQINHVFALKANHNALYSIKYVSIPTLYGEMRLASMHGAHAHLVIVTGP